MDSFTPTLEYWIPEQGLDDPCLKGLFEFWLNGNLDVFTESNGPRLLKLLRELNIQPIIYDLLRQRAVDIPQDQDWIETLRTEALQIVGTCAYRQHIIETLAVGFEKAGVKPIWLKGPGLGHTVYPRPHWRTYKDLDLLILPAEWDAAVEVMINAGYESTPCLNWGFISFEKAFNPIDPIPGSLNIELHYRLSNRRCLSVFSYQELLSDAQDHSGFSYPFLVPHRVKHFIFVCLHRMGHHPVDRRFAWLMDVKYLVESFSEEDWRMALDLAKHKEVSKVLYRNLLELQQVFPSPIPPFILESLRDLGKSNYEASEILLLTHRHKWTDLWTRWWDMPGISSKVKYLLHWAMPPKAYLNATMGAKPLIIQHKDRFFRGVKKYFQKGKRD